MVFWGRLATLPTIRPPTQKSVATPLLSTPICTLNVVFQSFTHAPCLNIPWPGYIETATPASDIWVLLIYSLSIENRSADRRDISVFRHNIVSPWTSPGTKNSCDARLVAGQSLKDERGSARLDSISRPWPMPRIGKWSCEGSAVTFKYVWDKKKTDATWIL